ncbi:unnamed protein product [Cochlearia groenlandica]
MTLSQSLFSLCSFITVPTLVAFFAVFSLRIFLKFATFLVTRPWLRHRTFTVAKDTWPRPFCVVCLQETEQGDKIRRLTICRHCFHADCIDSWLFETSTCPLCRAEIPPLPPANPLLLLFVPVSVIRLFRKK